MTKFLMPDDHKTGKRIYELRIVRAEMAGLPPSQASFLLVNICVVYC